MRHLFVGMAMLLLGFPVVTAAQGVESVTLFDAQVQVSADRTVQVTETITYDFGAEERHGIYREIPVRYERNGGAYKLNLKVTDVLMDSEPVTWKIVDRSPLRIRIGDEDVTVTGRHTYTITYRTDRALNFFEGEAELYWNVTGNGWEVPISAASIAVQGPEGFDAGSAQSVCFVGPIGSTEQTCEQQVRQRSGESTITFASGRVLSPGEGMTVAVRFPAGLIAPPTNADRVTQFVADNGVLALPILVFMVMFGLWYTRGREPQGKGTVVPHYVAPRKLSPAEMVSLRSQQVPTQAVTATILDLARRGYFTIAFEEKKKLLGKTQEYTFIKKREADAALSPAEQHIFSGLFTAGNEVALKDLQGTFYKDIAQFKSAVMASLQEKKFFSAHPERVRGAYIGVAIAVLVGLFWLVASFITPVAIVAFVVSAVLVAVFGYFMPQKTKEGAVVLEEVEGFKWFLSVTEKDRLAFHQAPALKPAQFHQFLPAAIAFGVEKQWAEQFKGLDVPAPDYATGMNSWNTLWFASAMTDFGNTAASSAYAMPSSAGSGGSGFSGGGSGGGFGGGGGGSW